MNVYIAELFDSTNVYATLDAAIIYADSYLTDIQGVENPKVDLGGSMKGEWLVYGEDAHGSGYSVLVIEKEVMGA